MKNLPGPATLSTEEEEDEALITGLTEGAVTGAIGDEINQIEEGETEQEEGEGDDVARIVPEAEDTE